MLTKDEFQKRQDELDEEVRTIWENPFLDGITHYESYMKAPVRLLWILKEPHGDGYRDLRELFACPKEFYPRWLNTFGNIMRVSWAILENAQRKAGIYDFSQIPEIDTEKCMIDSAFVLEEVAIINLKKQSGETSTKDGILDREYNRKGVKEFLFKQIEFINPEIIINCHGVTDFINDQLSGNQPGKINDVGYGFNGGRLIIDTRHPFVQLVKDVSDENYCNNILSVFKAAK